MVFKSDYNSIQQAKVGVYAQIFNQNGKKVGNNFKVSEADDYNHPIRAPKVAEFDNGYIIVWGNGNSTVQNDPNFSGSISTTGQIFNLLHKFIA